MRSAWFKNLRLYRLRAPFELDAETMAAKLAAAHRFKPCGRLQEQSLGFVPPALPEGAPGHALVHAANGCLLVCVAQQKKLLPAHVVRDGAADRIAALESQRGLRLGKRERDRILDDVRFELLPQAFARTTYTLAYVDTVTGWLFVDAAADNAADLVVDLLIEALGALDVAPPATRADPAASMTGWLASGETPADIVIGVEGCLRDPFVGGAVVRCRGQDMASDEMAAHLTHGKTVERLALEWEHRLAFVLDMRLSVTRLRWREVVTSQAGETDDEIERFDQDFALMSLELRALSARLVEIFGGLTVKDQG